MGHGAKMLDANDAGNFDPFKSSDQRKEILMGVKTPPNKVYNQESKLIRSGNLTMISSQYNQYRLSAQESNQSSACMRLLEDFEKMEDQIESLYNQPSDNMKNLNKQLGVKRHSRQLILNHAPQMQGVDQQVEPNDYELDMQEDAHQVKDVSDDSEEDQFSGLHDNYQTNRDQVKANLSDQFEERMETSEQLTQLDPMSILKQMSQEQIS